MTETRTLSLAAIEDLAFGRWSGLAPARPMPGRWRSPPLQPKRTAWPVTGWPIFRSTASMSSAARSTVLPFRPSNRPGRQPWWPMRQPASRTRPSTWDLSSCCRSHGHRVSRLCRFTTATIAACWVTTRPPGTGRAGRSWIYQRTGIDRAIRRIASGGRDQPVFRRSTGRRWRAGHPYRSECQCHCAQRSDETCPGGKPIPVGWALDADGNPTTDPELR